MSEIKVWAVIRKKDGTLVRKQVTAEAMNKFKAKHPLMPAAYDKFKKHGAIWTSK